LDAIFAYMKTRVYTPLPRVPGPDGKAGSIFRNLLAGLPRYIMADPSLLKIVHILFIEMHRNARIRDYLKKEYGEQADVFMEALFRKQMEDGTIRSCDPRALALVFNGFRFAWLYQTFILDYDKPKDIKCMEQDLQGPIAFFEELLEP
ncbi:MAG TPA: TetR/AcrR family transcriptional regulator, partial [Methanoregula sp.]|nr:TetR/AcrR family transcriptional regulator [Methanoregula sp.]